VNVMRVAILGIVLVVAESQAAVSSPHPQAEPTPRMFQAQPASPDRVSQRLSITLDFLGGYDDNLTPESEGSISAFLSPTPGYVGSSNATLSYWIGQRRRSLEISSQAFMNSYLNVGREPSYGADLKARGFLSFGNRTILDVFHGVRSDPFVMLGAFDRLTVEPNRFSPDANSASALAENRSLINTTTASVRQQWTRTKATRLEYRFDHHAYERSVGLDNRSHAASLSYEQSVSRTMGLQASYRYSDIDSIDPGALLQPIVDQTADIGVRYERAITRSRRISFTAGGGTTFFETVDRTTNQAIVNRTPSARAGVNLQVGKGWQAGADYRRSVSGLNGLLGEAFVADSATVQIGGMLGETIDATVGLAYSTGVGTQSDLSRSSFDTYATSAQLRFLASRFLIGTLGYTHNRYSLNEQLASTTISRSGLPPKLERNTVRIGVTVFLPIIGGRSNQPVLGRN
jgi:hypothetical protein